MNIAAVTGTTTDPGVTGGRKADSPEKIEKAAQQFEALLIGQLLKTSREAGGGGWMGTGDDQAGAIGMEMAEQEFARMLAAGGGLGMAKTIAAGLRHGSSSGPATAAADTPPGSGE